MNRDEVREYLSEQGITVKIVTRNQVLSLRKSINKHLKSSGIYHGTARLRRIGRDYKYLTMQSDQWEKEKPYLSTVTDLLVLLDGLIVKISDLFLMLLLNGQTKNLKDKLIMNNKETEIAYLRSCVSAKESEVSKFKAESAKLNHHINQVNKQLSKLLNVRGIENFDEVNNTDVISSLSKLKDLSDA